MRLGRWLSNDRCCEQANAYSIRGSDHWRELEPVVHRVAEILLAALIGLGSLHGDMAEEELNLFQFADAAQAILETDSTGRRHTAMGGGGSRDPA